MRRTAIAFIVAPLWTPLVVAPYAALVVFPHNAQFHWVVIATILSIIFSYGGTVVLGVPMFLLLRRRHLTAFWIAPIVGAGIALGTYVVFLILFALSLGSGLGAAIRDILATITDSKKDISYGIVSLLGALTGGTIWLMARPDRDRTIE